MLNCGTIEINNMKQYYPSNGTEGMEFMSEFCDNCYKNKSCTILTRSLIGIYPKQWIYNDNDHPVCTSFNPNRPKPKPKQDLPSLF